MIRSLAIVKGERLVVGVLANAVPGPVDTAVEVQTMVVQPSEIPETGNSCLRLDSGCYDPTPTGSLRPSNPTALMGNRSQDGPTTSFSCYAPDSGVHKNPHDTRDPDNILHSPVIMILRLGRSSMQALRPEHG